MSGARSASVVPGLEVFLEERAGALRGRRVGLIANPASVDSRLRHAVQRLRSAAGLDLTALFGPEHGLSSQAQDMVPVGEGHDPSTGLRVFSLYGESPESLSPTEAMLEEVEILLADLQDVGARYYTFAATIALALEAVARRGGRLIVLDRPNPLGGLQVEGPGLEPAMRSFVGHIGVPVRHGLTMGELILQHAREKGLADSLEVVPMRGWRREMSFESTGLAWIPPSPNMPAVETAYVYPGSCLIEATNLSEGRGTTRPFEWIGAPFLDPRGFADSLNGQGLAGVIFRPLRFEPGFHKWSGRCCGGVALHVVDRLSFRPVRTGVAMLVAARALAPSDFAWRAEPYEFVADRPAIDLLSGSPALREGIEAGLGWPELTADWHEAERAWRERRRSLLLYG